MRSTNNAAGDPDWLLVIEEAAAPTAPTVEVWNGTTLQPATVGVWNGATVEPATASVT